MAFRLPGIRSSSLSAKLTSSKSGEVLKGYLAIYVGERNEEVCDPYILPDQPSFQESSSQVEEEFGYDHPMGALTIPCTEDVFLKVTSSINGC